MKAKCTTRSKSGHRQRGALQPPLAAFCLIVFLNTVSIVFAQELALSHHFKDVAQDGQGVVWAIDNQLHVFNGREWTAMPAPFAEEDKASAMHLTRMQDNSVACVWQLSNERLAVTQQTGKESRLLGVCPGKIEHGGSKSRLFADSHNRLWITDAKPDIYRADREGRMALAYSIEPEQLIDANDLKAHYGNVFASEDGHGRVWVWTDSWAGGMNGAALRGVLVFEGDKVEQREKFTGINNPRFSFIDRRDDKHMWVAAVKEGVFIVDIDTLEAKPLAEPEPGAFQWVKKIFSTEDDLFVIASRTGKIFETALWREHGGKWTRLIESVDNHFNSHFDFDRSWLRVGRDIILCSNAAAPWLIHEDATVERLDWQRGFAVENARRIFLLSDGSLFGHGADGQVFCGKVSLAAGSRPHSRATELVISRHGWTIDADDNVWAILFPAEQAINKWNGSRWFHYEIPGDVKKQWIGGMIADTRGRVWLLPDSNELVAAYYDSHGGKWKTFPRIEAAFESVKTDPPRFTGDRPKFYAPDFSADHQRITFRNNKWQVAFFDGAKWRYFNCKEITGKNERDTVLGAPFFNSDGRVCVKIKQDTWQFDDLAAWQQTKPEDRFPDEWTGHPRSQQKINPPESCVTKSPDSIVTDNQGAFWLTWQGRLYKCGYGTCVEIFSHGERNPFADGRKISDAWVDRRGSVFLTTASDKRMMIKPKSTPPRASITVEKRAADSIKARLRADSRSQIRFSWRLDGEPWQLTKEQTLALDSLASGPHTLTVLAIDEELQASPATVATFEIKIDTQHQMAALITRLADPDFAKRQSAVVALTRQPKVALVALKTAREKAGDDQLWWIDAAIQEIERKTKVENPAE